MRSRTLIGHCLDVSKTLERSANGDWSDFRTFVLKYWRAAKDEGVRGSSLLGVPILLALVIVAG